MYKAPGGEITIFKIQITNFKVIFPGYELVPRLCLGMPLREALFPIP